MTYRAARALRWLKGPHLPFPLFAWNDPEQHRYPWTTSYKPWGYGHCSWPRLEGPTRRVERILHMLDHLLSQPAYHALVMFLVLRVGVLDSHTDGGILFWRLAFWRSNHRRAAKTGRWPTRACRTCGDSFGNTGYNDDEHDICPTCRGEVTREARGQLGASR